MNQTCTYNRKGSALSSSTLSHSSSFSRSSTSLASSMRDLADIVVTAAESSQKINTQAADIAQLRLSNLELHGRDDDVKLLRSKLRELAQKKNDDKEEHAAAQNNERLLVDDDHLNKFISNNLILVSGKSGTGKSALIRKGLGDNAAKLSGCAFASGKFDEKLLRPLSAFSDAMTNLAKCIKKGGLSRQIRDEIQDEFDEKDVEQLRHVLPGCADLLGERQTSSLFSLSSYCLSSYSSLFRSSSDSSVYGPRRNSLTNVLAGKESISQKHFAIRRLLKVICSYLKGVILFIDDLQWSDTATLDLLKSILLDGEIPSLMIVGAYREDEVPEHHPLAFHVQDLEQMNVSITKIEVGNLGVENVIPLVAEALRMEDDDIKVKSLAETIHKKTEGNPFFVLTFLRSLYDEKLLQYNFGAMKWTWDDEAVNSKIVTENVASVLVNKMNRLQGRTQLMLMVASCLGPTFQLSAVMEIMKKISRVELGSSMRVSRRKLEADERIGSSFSPYLSRTSFSCSIEELVGEGLCEVDDEGCHFVHDQIQSAAFELISPDQRDSFRGKIGCILLDCLSPEELEDSLFEVVGLLNYAASKMTYEDLNELASMNLNAGIMASENAAFDAAAIYFQAGREALGSRGWEEDHSVMLDLCSHAANAYYVTGDFDSMNELIEEVLSKDIDTKEKFRVTDIKAKSLCTAGKHNECIDAALDFRRQLGLPIVKRKPASKFTTTREYIRVKMLLKNKTSEDVASLPALDDERYEMGLMMNEHTAASVYNFEPTMLPLIIFQGVTTALKHGIGSTSSSYFAGLGMLLCGPFGKPHEGLEMAKAAELILEKPGKLFQSGAVYTLFRTQGLCYHWTSPLQDTISPLLKGYQVGLETGANEEAIWCLIIRSYHLYFIGRPLDSIQKELEAYITVMTQLKHDDSKLKITIVLTTVKKLRGIDVEAGDKMLDSVLAAAASNRNVTLSAYVNLFKLEVFVFFQQWRDALDLVRKAGKIRLILSCTFASVRYTFLEALTYLKAAQSTSGWKKRQMKKCAHKTIQVIQGWAKKGNVNVVHYLYILEAELAVLNGKNKKAKEKFKAAIVTSSRNGFIHDRALAHELASAYFKAQGDENWEKYHIERSRTFYQEWGCSEKVEQLMLM